MCGQVTLRPKAMMATMATRRRVETARAEGSSPLLIPMEMPDRKTSLLTAGEAEGLILAVRQIQNQFS